MPTTDTESKIFFILPDRLRFMMRVPCRDMQVLQRMKESF